MRSPRTFGSPPPMSSRHRNLEPLGRWHATIYISSQIVADYKALQKPLYACLIDFRKAFDRLNRNALMSK